MKFFNPRRLNRAGSHRIIRCGVPEDEFALARKKREKRRERIRSFDPARVKEVQEMFLKSDRKLSNSKGRRK